MLSPDWSTLRLFLHVLGAAVWAGGQVTLGGLVPSLRRVSADAPAAVARAFARLAWPALILLVGTGVWNMITIDVAHKSSALKATLWVKLGVVALSGLSAAVHSRARSRRALALWGALAGLSALGALFLGVLLGQS
ncbi:MAG TPA: hypothetical protein VE990_12165 [Acidimicrobiales bacterium]|nr:hypothetical protein [Acidimicrobiales bacterium]